jgi:hypothetical protein
MAMVFWPCARRRWRYAADAARTRRSRNGKETQELPTDQIHRPKLSCLSAVGGGRQEWSIDVRRLAPFSSQVHGRTSPSKKPLTQADDPLLRRTIVPAVPHWTVRRPLARVHNPSNFIVARVAKSQEIGAELQSSV